MSEPDETIVPEYVTPMTLNASMTFGKHLVQPDSTFSMQLEDTVIIRAKFIEE